MITPPGGLHLRRATPADIDIVLHHRLEMFREMGSSQAELEAVAAASRVHFAKRLADGTYHGWFLVEDSTDKVVTGAGINMIEFHPQANNPQPFRPWVVNVYTDPAYRKRGLARLLMDELIAWCREQGYKTVVLHASNEGRRLYESMGFEPTNEMRLRLD